MGDLKGPLACKTQIFTKNDSWKRNGALIHGCDFVTAEGRKD